MYYIIYKTTNILNGKYYIGMHQTTDLDDDYMGSGFILKRAIKKYGAENFVKEILHIFKHKWQMNLAERILVVPDYETNYNIVIGGKGGALFKGRKHSLDSRKKISTSSTGKKLSDKARKNISLAKIGEKNPMFNIGINHRMFGKHHSTEIKQKISKTLIGHKYGIWVNNGVESKRVNEGESIPQGFVSGRGRVKFNGGN